MSKTKIIEKLSKQQEKLFPKFVKKWTTIGLCTDPANRKEAELGIVAAYRAAGLKEPKIVWCGSPMSQGLTRAILLQHGDKIKAQFRESVGESVRESVRESVWESVGESVWESVRESVGESVRESVRESVWESVWESVRESVWGSVRGSVGESVWESVRESVWESVRESVWESGHGQHDANWLAFYDYCCDVLGLKKQTEKLSGLWLIAKNANWFLPHEKICWVCERPNLLNRDERGRLHSFDKPALSYPDGWALHYIHGVRVPEKYILTPAEKIDPAEVLAERNAEVRMAVISKIGFQRIADKLKGKVISSVKSTRAKEGNNELVEFELDRATVRCLRLVWDEKTENGKQTIIPVPRTREQFERAGGAPDNIDDVEQVRRWTMGLTSKDVIVAEA